MPNNRRSAGITVGDAGVKVPCGRTGGSWGEEHADVDKEQDQPADFASSNYPQLVRLLDRLDEAKVSYDVKTRPASVRLSVMRRRRRWEVRFAPDGSVEIQRYEAVGEPKRELAVLDEIFTDDE